MCDNGLPCGGTLRPPRKLRRIGSILDRISVTRQWQVAFYPLLCGGRGGSDPQAAGGCWFRGTAVFVFAMSVV